jgi:hypothetical protein
VGGESRYFLGSGLVHRILNETAGYGRSWRRGWEDLSISSRPFLFSPTGVKYKNFHDELCTRMSATHTQLNNGGVVVIY